MNKAYRYIVYVIMLFLFFVVPDRLIIHIYAVDCKEATGGENLTLTSSCLFAGTVNGVDNGASPKNTAIMTVAPDTTLTVIPGQTIVAGSFTIGGGKIIVFDGAQLYPGGSVWMNDGDADGYPSSTDRYGLIEGATAPVGYVRKSQIYQSTISDRDDTIPCPDYAFKPSFIVPLCKICYHGFPDPLAKNAPDSRCTSGQVCDGIGACYSDIKRVFISSASYTGALGGLTGADSKCQLLADTASLGGVWKAWLSDTTTSVTDRFTHGTSPYYLVDRTTKIANDWTGIVSGSLLLGITIDEKFQAVGPGTKVWTNTRFDGTKFTSVLDDSCDGWTTDTHRGLYGLNERFGGSGWTDTNYTQCRNPQRLYCFEQ